MIRHVLEFKNIFVGYSNRMEEEVVKMSSSMRYYHLHRDVKNTKALERYHNKPEVIAKKAERERKKAEKEAQQKAEKEAKQKEKERKQQEQIQLALATRKVTKKVDGGLNHFLGGESPV
jgi:FKBP-type peptidyl-prolyl cis-trans isomerase